MKAAKQRILFLTFSLFAICGVLLWGAYGARFIRHFHLEPRPKDPLPILMYHHVAEDGEACNEMTVTVGKLREDIEYLYDHGYTPILPRELASNEPLPKKPVMITFDDGYQSNYVLLLPLLQEYDCKANINVIVSLADKPNKTFLTWEQIRELNDSGLVEIGSHSYYLHNLDERNGTFTPGGVNGIQRKEGEDDDSFDFRVLYDLQRSYDRIAEELGTAPTCFAYPFGQKEPDATATAEALYSVTLLTHPATADLAKGTHDLPRYTITMEKPLSEVLK